MGALPRLKKKDELKYRKGSTDEGRNCRYCRSFVIDFKKRGIGGDVRGTEPRCQLLGLENSIRYRVREDHTCNRQVRDDAKCWWLKESEKFL